VCDSEIHQQGSQTSDASLQFHRALIKMLVFTAALRAPRLV
jgi:hypothetical protein